MADEAWDEEAQRGVRWADGGREAGRPSEMTPTGTRSKLAASLKGLLPHKLATGVQGVGVKTGTALNRGYNVVGGGLNKGIDMVGDRVATGALKATAEVGGKELLWTYIKLILEDMDKDMVRVGDRGVKILCDSEVRQNTLVALLGGSSPLAGIRLGPLEISVPLDEIAAARGQGVSTPIRITLSSLRCDWLPFPDLLPSDEVFELLSELMDPKSAELSVVDGEDASRAAKKQLERERRDKREVKIRADLRTRHPTCAGILDFVEGRLFLFAVMGLVVVALLSDEVVDGDHKKDFALRLSISIFFVLEIMFRLGLYQVLRPRGFREFFESWLNLIDILATVADLFFWAVISAEHAGVGNSARSARLVRCLRFGRTLARVGRVAAASTPVWNIKIFEIRSTSSNPNGHANETYRTFEISTRGEGSSKNQPNRLGFDRARDFSSLVGTPQTSG